MRKFLALLLCISALLILCACDEKAQEAAPAPTLQVGFGRTDITPQGSIQLPPYLGGVSRWSKDVLDPLYATCLAFSDADGNTVLLFHLDLGSTGGSKMPLVRKAVSNATGVPIDNVMVAATHTHSAPHIRSEQPSMEPYWDYLEEQMVAAAQAAMEDRKPAEMYTVSTTLEKMNFVRHYRLDDGSVIGDNFGSRDGKTIVGHVKEADNEMQLIRFTREGGKDVMLVNWQVHPHRTGGASLTDVSADIVGSMRMYLEPQMGCYMAYFTGASSNLNPTSRIASEKITGDYLDQGSMMADAAILACDTMTKQKVGKVQILRRDQEAGINGMSIKFVTYAFSIGDVAFVTAPYEMFDTNGEYIKDHSPFDTTFVVTCANGAGGYVVAEWAYYEDITSYEADTGGYNKGTAEKLAEGYVEMLEELYPTR